MVGVGQHSDVSQIIGHIQKMNGSSAQTERIGECDEFDLS